MNARIRLNRRPPESARQHAQPRLEPYPLTGARIPGEQSGAANDARARGRFEHFRDPLWFIAFAMGTFFALMAFFLAWV